jgi:hypothetical protein
VRVLRAVAGWWWFSGGEGAVLDGVFPVVSDLKDWPVCSVNSDNATLSLCCYSLFHGVVQLCLFSSRYA